VNIFGNKRLDAIEPQLASVSTLSLAIEKLANRFDARLTSVEKAEAKDHELLQAVNEAIDRLDITIEAPDECARTGNADIHAMGEGIEAVNATVDEHIVRLGGRIDALANETVEGARIVNRNADESSADRARLVKLEARLDALVAHLDKGCETMNHNIALLAGAAGFTLENPTADMVTDLPRPPLAERVTERRARRRIRRAAA
jgi:chromosome segregation ATPase